MFRCNGRLGSDHGEPSRLLWGMQVLEPTHKLIQWTVMKTLYLRHICLTILSHPYSFNRFLLSTTHVFSSEDNGMGKSMHGSIFLIFLWLHTGKKKQQSNFENVEFERRGWCHACSSRRRRRKRSRRSKRRRPWLSRRHTRRWLNWELKEESRPLVEMDRSFAKTT